MKRSLFLFFLLSVTSGSTALHLGKVVPLFFMLCSPTPLSLAPSAVVVDGGGGRWIGRGGNRETRGQFGQEEQVTQFVFLVMLIQVFRVRARWVRLVVQRSQRGESR